MGADIHMVLERRDKKHSRWVGLHGFYTRKVKLAKYIGDDGKRLVEPVTVHDFAWWEARARNYDLFAALAGVRGQGPDPRGIPDDPSDLAVMEIDGWGSDGHSHSWMLVEEALPVWLQHHFNREGDVVKAMVADGKSFEEACADIIENEFGMAYFDPDRETLADYRLVFWFDN